MTRKIHVLDTNVLLHDPAAIYKFEDNEVVIPIYVIEEVDTFKRETSELGRNARQIARYLDELREKSGCSLQQGVDLGDGGRLRVAVPQTGHKKIEKLDNRTMDHAIMGMALEERDNNPEHPVIFVTMDSNLRIRADAWGLTAENYEGGRVAIDGLYTGIVELSVQSALVDRLARREDVPLEELGEYGDAAPLHPNACVVLRDRDQHKHTALGSFNDSKGVISPLRGPRDGAWGIRARNMEQHYAMDMLLNPDVNLVTLVGKAGTGKTLVTIAAGLKSVIDDGRYARLLVSRPIFPLGRDVGFLPGTIEEKLNPWMQPIFDNLEYIFSTGRPRGHSSRDWSELVAEGTVQVEPLTYIRGRSLPNQFLVVDEAQNLTPHEVKTIITRCGTDTKIVLTGDPYQIDNPYVDSASNGLNIVAERFKDERIAAHVTLTKGERSELAERATELL